MCGVDIWDSVTRSKSKVSWCQVGRLRRQGDAEIQNTPRRHWWCIVLWHRKTCCLLFISHASRFPLSFQALKSYSSISSGKAGMNATGDEKGWEQVPNLSPCVYPPDTHPQVHPISQAAANRAHGVTLKEIESVLPTISCPTDLRIIYAWSGYMGYPTTVLLTIHFFQACHWCM